MSEESLPRQRLIKDHREPVEDPLLELQLRVARRADELAAAQGRTLLNLLCWLQAEEEILHRLRSVGHMDDFQMQSVESSAYEQGNFSLQGLEQGANEVDSPPQAVSDEVRHVFSRA